MAFYAVAEVIAGSVSLALPNSVEKARPVRKEPDEEHSQYNDGNPVFTVRPDSGLPIRYAQKGVASERFGTVPYALKQAAIHQSQVNALMAEAPGYPADGPGTWIAYTWSQYYEEARKFAKSLLVEGFEPFSAVAICGFNSPEWFFAHMGVAMARGMSAGTYTTSTPLVCRHIVEDSGAVVAVVDSLKNMEKYLQEKDNMPHLRHVVVYRDKIPDAVRQQYGDYVMSFAEFVALGSSVSDETLDKRIDEVRENECFNLIYTSGTTGEPKGVMISHDNALFAGASVFDMLEVGQEPAHLISYLPLSHIAAQLLDMYIPTVGAWRGTPPTIWFARPDALRGSLAVTMKAVRPTAFLGVPRVWEKIVEGVKAKAREKPATGLMKSLIDYSRNVTLEASRARQVGGSGIIPRGYRFARATVIKKVKTALGLDRTTFFITSAAPISIETQEFVASLGIDLMEFFGMSETTGHAIISAPYRFRFGVAGASALGCELKIDHDPSRDKEGEGEICCRGRHVMMGYLHGEEKTREVIDGDGWLHSGDVGSIDEDGMVHITGRIKEIIIGAGGENVAPVPIENAIKKFCPGISNVVLVGDRRKYLTALVSLKLQSAGDNGDFTNQLIGESLTIKPGVTTLDEAVRDPAFTQYVEGGIAKYNQSAVCLSNAWRVQKFQFLPTDLSIPGGELTATMKVRRSIVHQKYVDLIDRMYGEDQRCE